jgi:hypothetical protein
MKASTFFSAVLICLMAGGLVGCKRNIVSAAPPSVAAPPPPAPEPQPQPEIVTPPAEAKETIPVEPLPPPAPEPEEPAPPPVRPKPPAPAEAEAPAKPEAPQISPQLSPAQLANAQRRTSDAVRVAERNLQIAGGKNLNASQKDLLEKVRGFLAQAHEAILAVDWVRAQNLAEKAQVLSAELIKSL